MLLSSASGPLMHGGSGETHAATPASRFLVAWSPENLTVGAEKALDKLTGVRATTVRAGLDWMTASRSADGRTLDRPASGWAIPLEMAVVKPHEYAHFVDPADAGAVRSLTRHHVLLSKTEASLRGGGRGLRLSVGRELRVSGVVSDRAAQGYEGLIAAPAPASWPSLSRFVLIRADGTVPRARIRGVIDRTLSPGQHLRIRSQTETRFLRFADAVQSQLIIKKNFGEFSARPLAGGRLQIDPRWLAKHIETRSTPILGPVTCHRKLFPQLLGALSHIRAKGLASTIDPRQFAGCFNPRYILGVRGNHLSHHSWGIALDINSSSNRYGAHPHQDPRLIAVMSRWGLTWGGRWLIPDGMHFEWMRFHR
jgi:D-alanyl-D-alanine carboxypeptidase